MLTAKVFTNGRSQAVRIPKEMRFEADEVGLCQQDWRNHLADARSVTGGILRSWGRHADR